MYITFGGCGCKGIKANIAEVGQGLFGHHPFNRTSYYDTAYLYYERNIVSGGEYLSADQWNFYQGWEQVNKWDGSSTKSHPYFGEYSNLFDEGTQYSNVTETSRTWTLNFTFNSPPFVVVMTETLSQPWNKYELREIVYNSLTEDVPWDDPFYFDLNHRIKCQFGYDSNGGFEFRNQIVYDLSNMVCNENVTVGQDYLGPNSGYFQSVSAFRRKFRQRIGTSYEVVQFQNAIYTPPILDCSIPPRGTEYDTNRIVEAYEIVLPPSQTEMADDGQIPYGSWGYRYTVGC